jgi:hypothetical protein
MLIPFTNNVDGNALRLLSSRRIGDFMSQCGLPRLARYKLLQRLLKLQSTIYNLDCIGENNWHPDDSELQLIWEQIAYLCGDFGGGLDIDRGLEWIKEYQQVEAGMRSGIQTGELEILHFYSKKKCDVMLTRLLVTRVAGIEIEAGPLHDAWDRFDLAAEIIDDICDVQEDCCKFNGNRLLSAALMRDLRVVYEEYSDFLADIRRSAFVQSQFAYREGHGQRCEEEVLKWVAMEARRGLLLLKHAFLAELPQALRILEKIAA